MKKHKLKFNNLRFVARVMLIIFLLTSVVSLVGCIRGLDKYVVTRRRDTQWYTHIEMIVSSNTKVFLKGDVTLNLSYAMHMVESDGELIIKNYYDSCIEEYDLIYGLYIADNDDYKQAGFSCLWYANDIENIEGYQFVKKISEEEALSDDYLGVSPWFASGYGWIEFNHTEVITIPKEYVSNRMGYFDIIITVFGKTDNSYVALDSVRVECFYKELDENTIEIDMKDWEYFRIMKPLFE